MRPRDRVFYDVVTGEIARAFSGYVEVEVSPRFAVAGFDNLSAHLLDPDRHKVDVTSVCDEYEPVVMIVEKTREERLGPRVDMYFRLVYATRDRELRESDRVASPPEDRPKSDNTEMSAWREYRKALRDLGTLRGDTLHGLDVCLLATPVRPDGVDAFANIKGEVDRP